MSKKSKGLKNTRRRKKTGSPNIGEPEFLVIGRLGRPHGVAGESQFFVLTDFPERIHERQRVFVGKRQTPMVFAAIRPHTNKLIIRFDGISDRDQADEISGSYVFIPMSDVPPLPDGEYYHHQLLKLNVVTEDGQSLGEIVEIIVTGANDVYVVRPEDGKDILLPSIDEVVLAVDVVAKKMTVRLLPGLLPD